MLREGLEKCARFHRIPMAELSESLDEFRRGGYRNEWLYKRQLLRPVGLHASLLCRLDIERFVLALKLERQGETVFEEAILETLPDEIIFAFRFRKVVLEGDTLVVRGRYDIPTFSLKLASLGLSR